MEKVIPFAKKQAVVGIVISDKVDFEPKLIRGDGRGHYIIIKRNSFQDDISVLNIYAEIQGQPLL